MCGIYAVYIQSKKSNKTAGHLTIEGLKRLEYRGYDSWGICVSDHSKLFIDKHVGQIGLVKEVNVPAADRAIGHTRWATHGGVTDMNAHPHISSNRSFALVQNGVVENYQELKEKLSALGYQFVTQTDTEVIVYLIEEAQKRSGRSQKMLSFEIIAEAFQLLAGRNTIAVLTKEGDMFAIRNGSPLVIGKDDMGNMFFASDLLSIAPDVDSTYALDSGEGIAIVHGEAKLYETVSLIPKDLKWQVLDVQVQESSKTGYTHFMWKEICEQMEVLHQPLQQDESKLTQLVEKIKQTRQVYVVGAGSADIVSNQITFWLREQGIVAYSVKAYEAHSFLQLAAPGDLCIALSQSGETADTVESIEVMKKKGVVIVSLVNMPSSTLSRLADFSFMLQVGPEIGIASTKAVTGMLVWGWALSQLVGGKKLKDLKQSVLNYEQQLREWFDDDQVQLQLSTLVQEVLMKAKNMFILGRGQLYSIALESALKLKEISYLHAEGFSGGELKHGVIALVEEGTPVMCLLTADQEMSAMLNAAAEVKARGARVIGISSTANQLFDDWIKIPHNDTFSWISALLPAQFLTYSLALAKGLNPDKPRNLAKSVTVK
jgi:glucosamine--fructose-6-phosphate aminotransferase (isomerizing)